jgi:acyl CoA:acetate/3-ketoacid CoA transferase beta subunit
MIGGRLARETFEPSLVMTDGFAMFTASCLPPGVNPYRNVDGRLELDEVVESWNPYPQMFTVLWNGKRHVMMGASQIDRYGNQNIACIGDWHRPRAQLLGFRGAPGNTINHTTSYWVPNHTPKSFVEKVDVVSGVGYDRAAALGPRAARFHEIRRVVSNLGVFDFETPDHRMRVRSVHPGVSLEEVQESTGFELAVADDLDETRLPTAEELRLIREVIDPAGLRTTEVKN